MLLLLSSLAFAGWNETARENGCVFFLGDREGTVQPVRAECDWPIAADKLQALVGKSADHDLYFSAVEEAELLGPGPNGTELYYQRHVAGGISDRDVVLAFSKEAIPGGWRYAWTKAADQSKRKGQVEAVTDTGKWEVTATPGGSHVVYELRYDAGGSVPSFVVRWFQGSGIRTLVGEMRKWAETH